MCYAHKEFNFFDITKIMAKNGVGKSTIATAYNWCLFNSDYELKDNPVVRRIVNGKAIDDIDTSVELIFDIAGKRVSMKKVQKRTYNKDKTSYKDDNKYFINDVPKTLKDFNSYLDVDMNVFKMCSNINGFLNQKPIEMREYLFDLIGDISNYDIVQQNDELSGLILLLEKYTAEELTSMNKATISKINKDLPILDGQIKEKERDIQLKKEVDISDLEAKKNSIKQQLNDCILKQSDNDQLLAEYDKQSEDILNLKFALSDMERKANENNDKDRKRIESQINNLNYVIKDAESSVKGTESLIKSANYKMTELQEELTNSRDKWKTEKERIFDETSLICPYCKQEYPTEKKDKLQEDFKVHKENQLKKITSNGNASKKALDDTTATLRVLERDLIDRKEKLEKHKNDLVELQKQLSELPQDINITETEEYKELESKIAEKEAIMHKANSISEVKKELKTQETSLREQLSDCENQIAQSDTTSDEQRLEELKQLRINAEQNKANAEKILNMLDILDRVKNEALSEEINSHFNLVQWKLFELAKNGNYKSVCIPTVDGKSILTTMSNKGNRILGKLDICNSIQKISNLSVPIFLDDSESLSSDNQKKITTIIDSQLIMLIVNDSDELEIKEG